MVDLNPAAPRLPNPGCSSNTTGGVAAVLNPWSRKRRDRLLRIARLLDRWSAAIKRACEARTPRKGPRKPKGQLDMIGRDAA